ncbi:MAG: DDE-type integrase/transposase/recombinase [Puniceicoccaceae bacterium]
MPLPNLPSETWVKDYEAGFIHVDVKYLPQMPDESERKYLFAAIDRATRWVFFEVRDNKDAANAVEFVEALRAAVPFQIRTILNDNGKEFTDRICATGERNPTGKHPLDQLCAKEGIDHRLIRLFMPKTNEMVERFNGRISQILKTNRFTSSHELSDALGRYRNVYNHHVAQRALNHKKPQGMMKDWYQRKPGIFRQNPTTVPGLDTPKAPEDRSCPL